MTLHRRALLAAGAALWTGAAGRNTSTSAWVAYEARLSTRLGDAGGGRFDRPTARDLLALTNLARRSAGAMPVAAHDELAATARAHAADLAARAYVEHLSPEGFDPSDRLSLVGRTLLGSTSENIAYHRGPDPAGAPALMKLWRDSPRHWGNLLRDKHTHAGFGVARKGDRVYAVGLYARPDGELAEPVPFRVQSRDEIERALAGRVERVSWQPLAGGRGTGPDMTPPGVYQLIAQRRRDARTWDLLPGPIFVWRDAA